MNVQLNTISPQYMRETEILVSIIEVKSPAHYVVKECPSVDTSSEAKKFAEVQNVMRMYYRSIEPTFFQLPLKNSIVVICKDDDYYRAQVQSILSVCNGHLIKVYLLDYGRECTVPRSSVYQIRQDFLSHPFQAIHFKLSNVTPISLVFNSDFAVEYGVVDDWDPSGISFIEELRKGMTDAYIKVKGVMNDYVIGSLYMKLVDGDVKCINDELVAMKYAQYTDSGNNVTEISGSLPTLSEELDAQRRRTMLASSPSISLQSSALPQMKTPPKHRLNKDAVQNTETPISSPKSSSESSPGSQDDSKKKLQRMLSYRSLLSPNSNPSSAAKDMGKSKTNSQQSSPSKCSSRISDMSTMAKEATFSPSSEGLSNGSLQKLNPSPPKKINLETSRGAEDSNIQNMLSLPSKSATKICSDLNIKEESPSRPLKTPPRIQDFKKLFYSNRTSPSSSAATDTKIPDQKDSIKISDSEGMGNDLSKEPSQSVSEAADSKIPDKKDGIKISDSEDMGNDLSKEPSGSVSEAVDSKIPDKKDGIKISDSEGMCNDLSKVEPLLKPSKAPPKIQDIKKLFYSNRTSQSVSKAADTKILDKKDSVQISGLKDISKDLSKEEPPQSVTEAADTKVPDIKDSIKISGLEDMCKDLSKEEPLSVSDSADNKIPEKKDGAKISGSEDICKDLSKEEPPVKPLKTKFQNIKNIFYSNRTSQSTSQTEKSKTKTPDKKDDIKVSDSEDMCQGFSKASFLDPDMKNLPECLEMKNGNVFAEEDDFVQCALDPKKEESFSDRFTK